MSQINIGQQLKFINVNGLTSAKLGDIVKLVAYYECGFCWVELKDGSQVTLNAARFALLNTKDLEHLPAKPTPLTDWINKERK